MDRVCELAATRQSDFRPVRTRSEARPFLSYPVFTARAPRERPGQRRERKRVASSSTGSVSSQRKPATRPPPRLFTFSQPRVPSTGATDRICKLPVPCRVVFSVSRSSLGPLERASSKFHGLSGRGLLLCAPLVTSDAKPCSVCVLCAVGEELVCCAVFDR